MAVNRNIKVTLSNDEYDFIKWLAKRDNIKVSKELQCLFNLQLREEMDLYYAEYETDKED